MNAGQKPGPIVDSVSVSVYLPQNWHYVSYEEVATVASVFAMCETLLSVNIIWLFFSLTPYNPYNSYFLI